MMNFLELCKKVIRVDSTPSSGNTECAIFCKELCEAQGLRVHLQPARINGKDQYNLIARLPSANNTSNHTSTNEVLFQSHLDTVEPGPMGHWSKTDHNAFQATVEGDRIYGLGTADVKLDFLCKLRALSQFKDAKFSRPVVLAGTHTEEIGMNGARQLIETGIVRPAFAVIGEPSELQIVFANNGYMVVEFHIPFCQGEGPLSTEEITASTEEKIFYGKAAHSSTPHLGDNAIHKVADYLEKLPRGIRVIEAHGGSSVNTVPAEAHIEIDLARVVHNGAGERLLKLVRELQKLSEKLRHFVDERFDPSYPTLNIGFLSTDDTGFKINVSFRITPQIGPEEAKLWVTDLAQSVKDWPVETSFSRVSPAALTDPAQALIKAAVTVAASLGLPEKPITKASGTEMSVYSKHGIQCFVFGPGVSIGNSHTANEYNLLSHLEKATLFYTELIKRFCL